MRKKLANEKEHGKIARLEKRLSELENKYGAAYYLVIMGNETADKLAIEARSLPASNKIPRGIKRFVFEIEEVISSTPIDDLLKNKQSQYYIDTITKKDKRDNFVAELKLIDHEASKETLKGNSTLVNFIWKLRNKQLNGKAEMVQKIRKIGEDRDNLRLKEIYKDKHYTFCGHEKENTEHIICFCPKWNNHRDDMRNEINNYLGKIQVQDWTNRIIHDKPEKKLAAFGYFPKIIRKEIKNQVKNKLTQKICANLLFIQMKYSRMIYRD